MSQPKCWKLLWLAVVLAAPALPARALISNLPPDQANAWAANVGWLNWRPSSTNGVEVGQFVCAGFVYSGNVGWISLGSGSPADHIQYRNDSAADFGVNVMSDGALRGLAYGANIGWINFENTGSPRIDLHTGKLSGFAYGANIGWISLGDATFSLAVNSISPGADSDADGIPDAWELRYAGDLTTLSAAGDFDGDGQSDLQEYLADTSPVDPQDVLEITSVSFSKDLATATLSWTVKPTRQYEIEARPDLNPADPWQPSPLGLQLPGSATNLTRSLPAVGPHNLYRVRAVRPLSP